MKRLLKRASIFIIMVILALGCFSITGLASGSTIALSKRSLTVGDSLTVTVSVSAPEAMYSTSFSLKYDPAVLTFVSGDSANGGAGTVKVVSAPSGKSKESYTLTFKSVAAGSSTLSVADCMYANDSEVALAGASAAVNVTNPTLSDNATLKSLSLSSGALSPKFSASKISYTAKVPFSVTQCKVYATPADAGSKVTVSGNANLEVGATTRTVTVTSPSGAQKIYSIVITRLTEAESVSSVEEPTNEENDPLQVVVDDNTYTVLNDLTSIKLFNGFKQAEDEYNGTSVPVGTDEKGNFKIFYLKSSDSDTPIPFVKDKDGNLKQLKYMTIGENTYIFEDFPDKYSVPENYYTTNLELNGFNLKCFADNDAALSDFYYLYAFSDSQYSMYRYDKTEGVLQRYPEFKIVEADLVTKKDAGFIGRFNSLGNDGKIVVLCLTIALLGAIALVVLLSVKISHSGKNTSEVVLSDMYNTDEENSFSLNKDFNSEKDNTNQTDDEIVSGKK